MATNDILLWLIDDDAEEYNKPPCSPEAQPSLDCDDEGLHMLDLQDDSDDDTVLSDASKLDASQLAALEGLEAMVLHFLQQLSSSLPKPELDGAKPTELQELDILPEHMSNCVAIELADRKRLANLGFTVSRPVFVSELKAPCCRDYPKHTIRFPQNKRRGNARGLGTASSCNHVLVPNVSFLGPATLFRVIDLSHGGLHRGVSVSKRDIYYQDVALFQTQATVNNLVDDLAATCGVARSDLNIEAACKGLWCGVGLSMISRNGSLIAGQHNEPTLIPVQSDIKSIQLCDEAAWILVVEKDAVFQTLCRAGITTHPKLPGNGILITGKGYPDVATRDLVAALSRFTTIPLLALVDADAHGVDIFSCYKYGSRSMQHEQARLQAPRLQWIGVLSTDLNRPGFDKDELLPLSAHDHKKAISLLQHSNCALEPLWRRELTHMIRFRRKAEVEILASIKTPGRSEDPLVEYVLEKILSACDDMCSLEYF